MSRRGDPERIYQAQRAGIFARLTQSERLDELDAKHWISRWEREAERQNIEPHGHAFWDAAWGWISSERQSKSGPG